MGALFPPVYPYFSTWHIAGCCLPAVLYMVSCVFGSLLLFCDADAFAEEGGLSRHAPYGGGSGAGMAVHYRHSYAAVGWVCRVGDAAAAWLVTM